SAANLRPRTPPVLFTSLMTAVTMSCSDTLPAPLIPKPLATAVVSDGSGIPTLMVDAVTPREVSAPADPLTFPVPYPAVLPDAPSTVPAWPAAPPPALKDPAV